MGGGGDNVPPQPEGLGNFEDQLEIKRGEVLFQGPTHHKNQQKNVKLTFQEFVLNREGGHFLSKLGHKWENFLQKMPKAGWENGQFYPHLKK